MIPSYFLDKEIENTEKFSNLLKITQQLCGVGYGTRSQVCGAVELAWVEVENAEGALEEAGPTGKREYKSQNMGPRVKAWKFSITAVGSLGCCLSNNSNFLNITCRLELLGAQMNS
jgi:hypothetical protein